MTSNKRPADTSNITNNITESIPSKRRQRVPVACIICHKKKIKCDKVKPTCGSCAKSGKTCVYEGENQQSSHYSISPSSPLNSLSRKELIHQIEELKKRLNETEETISTNPNHYLNIQTKSEDSINVFQDYDSLLLKPSSHEDHKPLSHLAGYRKDHFFSFFAFFFFLYLRISGKMMDDIFRDDWKSKHEDGSSKWLTLLSFNKDDEKLREFAEKISKDRAQSKSLDLIPLLQFVQPQNTEHIQTEIKKLLPLKNVTEAYLSFFFEYIWILRPFVDETDFRQQMSRIVQYDDITGEPLLRLSDRADIATISVFLIILRYSSMSFSLMREDEINSKYLPLKTNPTGVKAISTAKLCLSFYKISKKATLTMLQGLVMLRYYLKDSPEDGDGVNLGQGQHLMGFIMQCALSMGLHRDPVNFSQFDSEINICNLRRRLWLGIVNVEVSSIILNGAVCNVPNESLVNVQFPLTVSNEPVLVAVREEYVNSSKVEKIFIEISDMFNTVDKKIPIADILEAMDKARGCINENYRLDLQRKIPSERFKLFSKPYLPLAFKNSKCISKILILKSLEVHVFGMIFLHYGSGQYSNKEKQFQFVNKLLTSGNEALDLSLGVLLGSLSEHLPTACVIEIYPLITVSCFRFILTLLTLVLHLLHAQHLLQFSKYHNKTDLRPEDFDPFIESALDKMEFVLSVFRDTLSLKYWVPLKCVVAMKYKLVVLRNHGLKVMSNILDFLNSLTGATEEDEGQFSEASITPMIKSQIRTKILKEKSMEKVLDEWVKLPNPNWSIDNNEPKFMIVNSSRPNLLAEMTRSELSTHFNALTATNQFVPDFNERIAKFMKSKKRNESGNSKDSCIIMDRPPNVQQVSNKITSSIQSHKATEHSTVDTPEIPTPIPSINTNHNIVSFRANDASYLQPEISTSAAANANGNLCWENLMNFDFNFTGLLSNVDDDTFDRLFNEKEYAI